MSPEVLNDLSVAIGFIVAILGASAAAFWIAMVIWTFIDIRSRSRDWLAILLACLLALIFPLVGVLLYLLIRPKDTLAAVYDRALEEEALLRELESANSCGHCGSPVKEEWAFCPTCHTQLQYSCDNCNELVRTDWDICAYCGKSQRTTGRQPTEAQSYSGPEFATATEQATDRRESRQQSQSNNPFARVKNK